MELDIVDYVDVDMEDVIEPPRLEQDLTEVGSGEAIVLVPILSGSLPGVADIAMELTRETSQSGSAGFQLKIAGLGGSQTAKVKVSRTQTLKLKEGETKTLFIVVPFTWHRYADPHEPGKTFVIHTPGEPPDRRYGVVIDDVRLPMAGAIDMAFDNLVGGDPQEDSESFESAEGKSFSLDIEIESFISTAAFSVDLETTTATKMSYILPMGQYTLSWLEEQSGLYVARR